MHDFRPAQARQDVRRDQLLVVIEQFWRFCRHPDFRPGLVETAIEWNQMGTGLGINDRQRNLSSGRQTRQRNALGLDRQEFAQFAGPGTSSQHHIVGFKRDIGAAHRYTTGASAEAVDLGVLHHRVAVGLDHECQVPGRLANIPETALGFIENGAHIVGGVAATAEFVSLLSRDQLQRVQGIAVGVDALIDRVIAELVFLTRVKYP
ncbi:hypothetical protein D3C78_828930 [compost metagenome]